MYELVKENAATFCVASSKIQKEYGFQLIAFASKDFVSDYTSSPRTTVALQRRIKSALQRLKAKIAGIVKDLAAFDEASVALYQPLDMSCPLTMLSQSTETTEMYKSMLNEFLGIPIGEERRLVGLVWENIATVPDVDNVIPHDTDDDDNDNDDDCLTAEQRNMRHRWFQLKYEL